MHKGIQKNMIWIRTPESRCFEAAYFVLRPERGSETTRKGEMLKEANRLIDERAGREIAPKRRSVFRHLLPFLIGLFVGMLLCLPLLLLPIP